MNIISFDNVIKDPEKYAEDILKQSFQNFDDNGIIFKNVQGRSNDEFENVVLQLFPNYETKWNFVRKSPLNQQEPTFIHNDAAMSDVTVILYLNKNHPDNDGTTIYDEENKPVCAIYAKFNRMIAFESELMHSRNIFENFGEGDSSRLIQVIFLKQKV